MFTTNKLFYLSFRFQHALIKNKISSLTFDFLILLTSNEKIISSRWLTSTQMNTEKELRR